MMKKLLVFLEDIVWRILLKKEKRKETKDDIFLGT